MFHGAKRSDHCRSIWEKQIRQSAKVSIKSNLLNRIHAVVRSVRKISPFKNSQLRLKPLDHWQYTPHFLYAEDQQI